MKKKSDEAKTSIGLNNLEVREKWLKKTLAAIPKGKKILDAGAGELQYKKFCKHLNYVSQDFGKYTGAGDGKALQTGTWDNSKLDIVSDITAIPVKKSSFDAVMCIEVLEHIPDPIGAIKEFSRILKKGGRLVITAPFCSITHFSPYFFHTGLSKYWYEKILQENGFKINKITANGNYFEYIAQELRRLYFTAEEFANTKIEEKSNTDNAIKNMLTILDNLNSTQHGSEELLNFGLHVLATKK
jgi:ubiquinone/menaquinone biosynthesis C-methylase UbiE